MRSGRQARPYFFTGFTSTAPGMACVPVAGGGADRDLAGKVMGAVGISGDLSDNDEIAAVAGINAAGLKADTGA